MRRRLWEKVGREAEVRALELRRLGLKQQAIADLMGVTREAARKCILRAESREADAVKRADLITSGRPPALVSDMVLPARAVHVFRAEGIEAVEALCRLTIVDLFKFRNMGVKTVRAVREELARYGLDIAHHAPDGCYWCRTMERRV